MPRKKKYAHKRERHYIKEWREATGKSQIEVGNEIGLDQSAMSKMESMKTPYGQDSLEKMARYFAGLLGPSYICTPAALISRPPAPLPDALGITNEEVALVRAEIARLDAFREPVRRYYLRALPQVLQRFEALPQLQGEQHQQDAAVRPADPQGPKRLRPPKLP